MDKIFYGILALVCITITASLAQPLPATQKQTHYFKHFGVDNGLSQNTVMAIFQDSQGFMWFGTKDGLNRYDGHSFRIFRHEPGNPNAIGDNIIRDINEDDNHQIWIGTDEGIFLYHPTTECFSPFRVATADNKTIQGEIMDIKKDAHGNMWIVAGGQGVFCYSKQQKTLTYHQHPSQFPAQARTASLSIAADNTIWTGMIWGGIQHINPKTGEFAEYTDKGKQLNDDFIITVLDTKDRVLIGTKNRGIKQFNKATKQITPLFSHDENRIPMFIRSLVPSSENEIWIGTETGLYIYNTQTNDYQHCQHHYDDPYSLSDNAIYSMYRDREGGMWVGTYFGGVNYYPHPFTTFEKYYPLAHQNSVSGKRVREFCEDTQGNIWIGTEDAGLNLFNPKTKRFINYKPSDPTHHITYHNVHGLLMDGDNLWIGIYTRGLDILNTRTGHIRHYENTGKAGDLGDNDVFSIYKDRNGQVWLGTIGGLYTYNPATDSFTSRKDVGNYFIYDIREDAQGYLWLSTYKAGLLRLDLKTQELKSFRYNPADSASLSNNSVISIFLDSQKRLWFATEGGGICQYNPQKENFTHYTTNNGLPSNITYRIVEDKEHNLWISTLNGLVRFNPAKKEMKTFTKADGLMVNQFNYKSGFRSSTGMLYFGSLNGFVAFDPTRFTTNQFMPSVVLTNFEIFNKEVPIGTENSPLKQSITTTQAITLPYDQSSLTFSFAALGFSSAESNRYAYKMEGLDKDWNYPPSHQKITYSRIPPGHYTFLVKASNGGNRWNTEGVHLQIHITPPFWRSPLAYAFYVLLGIGILYYLVTLYKKRLEKKHQESLQLLQNQQDKEIYNAKIEFFTTIAHEIRTPLTLIKWPLEQLIDLNNQEKPISKSHLQDNLSIMDLNTNRLIELTNQLLDFRKADQQGIHLNFVKTNINVLLQEVHAWFKAACQQKGIDFQLHLPNETVLADVDHEALNKLFSNLFSNAVKHATHTIDVQLEANGKEGMFQVTVYNDGPSIPQPLREKIFQPFFQVPNQTAHKGSGLGLPLARSLAELHKGNLLLDTTEETRFVVSLPLHQEHVINLTNTQTDLENSLQTIATDMAEATINSEIKYTLLIVEDNKDLQSYLADHLKPYYRIYKASSGTEALSILDQNPVDCVVSDVMMPLMNGFELCKEIKSRLEYSHVPVILLTAKSNMESKIEGLQMGADAYVEKPFSMHYLLLQINNLLKNRQQLRQVFSNSPLSTMESMAMTKADEQFLARLHNIIDQHLTDVHFGVEQLADELNMSQSSLLRKTKGISELTPNDLIRLVRLKKAAQLIEEGEYRITEICYMVGFNSSSYFAKCFQKQFGVLPKDYLDEKRNKNEKAETK